MHSCSKFSQSQWPISIPDKSNTRKMTHFLKTEPRIKFGKKEIVFIDYTSPALCTPITPFPADPFSVNAAATEWSLVLHDVIGDRMSHFAASALYCTVNGEKMTSRRLAMQPIINMLEEDWATDTGNMHKTFGKDRTCGSGDIISDRQTHRQTHSSQYFATALAREVIISFLRKYTCT